MSTGVKVPLRAARQYANELRDMLISACERVEVGGSIRREKAEVGDGEIVAIPRIVEGRNLLHWCLEDLVEQGKISKAIITDKNGKTSHRWGDDYRAVSYSGLKFDIFMTDAESWGYQFLLRTGPGDANTAIMTKMKYGYAPFRVAKGDVYLGDTRLPIRTERDFFMLLGMPYLEPKDRTEAAYKKHFGKGHKWGNPKDLLPRAGLQAPTQLRLLWNYEAETLAAYPIPEDFIDSATGMMWANTTTDRFLGEFRRVEKGSREAQFQHEFLVGDVQRRFELERLRKIIWKDQEIPVPGYTDIGDLPITYLVGGTSEMMRVPVSTVIPTQPAVYRYGVYEKAQVGRRWADLCAKLQGWRLEESLADTWNTWKGQEIKGLRFGGDERVYLIDGHHRFMAAQELSAEWLSVNVAVFTETYEQACGTILIEDDNDYTFLADVMEEVLCILKDEKVLA